MPCNDARAAHALHLTTLFVSGILTAFGAIGTALISLASANGRVRLLESLSEKSDEELSALSIRCEDIVRRVFHDALDI